MVRLLCALFISAAAMQAAHGVRIPSKSPNSKNFTAFQEQASEHDDMAQAQVQQYTLFAEGWCVHWPDSLNNGDRRADSKQHCEDRCTREPLCKGYQFEALDKSCLLMREMCTSTSSNQWPWFTYNQVAPTPAPTPRPTPAPTPAPTPPPTPCPTPPPPTPFPTAPPPTTQAPTPAPDDLCRRAFAAKCYEEDLYKQCCTVEQCAANDNWHVCGWAISLGPDRIASSYRYPDDSEALTCFEACQLFKISRPASDYCPGGMLERELEEKGCRLSVLSLHEQRTANKPVFDQYCGADVESSAIQSLAFVKGYSHSQESSQTRALHNTSDADLCRSAWDAGCYHDTATFAPCCPEPVCIHGGSVMTCDWTGFENMKGTFEFSSLDRSCFDSCAALSGDLPAIDFCIGGPISSTLAATGCRAAQDSFQGQQSEHEMALSPYCGGE